MLFAMLIGMISLVGFGNTTDPSENSNTITIECYDAQPVMVCVDFQITEVAIMPIENLMVSNYEFMVNSTGFKTDLKGNEFVKPYDLSFALKPPLLNDKQNRSFTNIKYPGADPMNQPLCNFCRNARDGLLKPNNFIS